MKVLRRVLCKLSILLVLLVVTYSSVSGHPLGGVTQKTYVTDLKGAILIEYKTHFGTDLLLTLNPDKDGNGEISNEEQKAFLNRVHSLVFANLSCTFNSTEQELKEIERNLTLELENDYKEGLNTLFVFHIPLQDNQPPPSEGGERLLRIKDENFKAGEMNRLNYYLTILGKTGQADLEGDGRELVIDLSSSFDGIDEKGIAHHSVSASETEADHDEEAEAESLIAFLKDDSGNIWIYIVGLLTAFVLGAFHALSPGHGKAMVAAYLVGTRGRIIDAVQLGVVVTITHVFSVIVLGIIALVVSKYTLSENIYPWLGVASGALIFLTGYFLLARTAFFGNHHHGHSHSHDHHHHGAHSHHVHAQEGGVSTSHSFKEILSLGIAGGLVPCPSAIVILLFAVAVGRIATGLLLILSFSLGLAAVLIVIGIATVTASQRMEKIGAGVGWVKRLPIFTAGIIMILGVAIGLNSLLRAGILTFHL